MPGADRPAAAHVSAISSLIRKGAGEVLFAEGDAQDNVYEVVRGMLRLYKLMPDGRRQVIGFLSAGQLLMASGPDGLCVSTAEAVTEVTVCRYPRAAFERLIDEIPGFARRLLALTWQALQIAHDQMLLLGRKVAMEKVASFILLLAERQHADGDPDTLDVPMTRADIADYLGLTVETVSRTFTRLKRDGLIDLPNPNLVHILDRERLEDIAAGDAGYEV
ncbi:MAG: helix-turn-helix domain-containing protein [Proteobacteria bacterium]|nr:helix-turn-helix domain-containing protein [Pseudomonadota bacterium]